MRNISFALTTEQMRARQKTVTRRRGDYYARVLKPGDLVCAVEKSQGIKRGGLVRICVIRVVSVRVEPLNEMTTDEGPYGYEETAREGFPDLTPDQFAAMFCGHMGGDVNQTVTRIKFEFPGCVCDHPADHHDARTLGCEFDPCPFVPAGGA